MGSLTIIDTFPAFLSYWQSAAPLGDEERLLAWEHEYMARWPELLAKQKADYEAQELSWREVALERVVPFLDERNRTMQKAHDNLLPLCEPVLRRAQWVLGYDGDLAIVLYVGIGCGAGWVTTYGGRPAILFGLENIAEEGWSSSSILQGLVAHELGHVIHFYWREQAGRSRGTGPWWQLYSEGFAQRCEHLIWDEETWHMAQATGEVEWLTWCRENEAWLAREFIRRVESGEDLRPFFASWFALQDHKQSGYYLGHQIMLRLQQHAPLEELALLPLSELEPMLRGELEALQK